MRKYCSPIKFSPEHLRAYQVSHVEAPTPGFVTYNRYALLLTVPEEDRDTYAEVADAWVERCGGQKFSREEPRRRLSLGSVRAALKAPLRKKVFYELPPDALGD